MAQKECTTVTALALANKKGEIPEATIKVQNH